LNLLLDTNVISKIIRGQEKPYRAHFVKSMSQGNIHCTSAIVKFELEYGALKAPHPEMTRNKQLALLARLAAIYDVTIQDADLAGNIRLNLERRGLPIGEYDVFIAAQAIRTNSILVTNNRKHFDRVNGLHVIDWSIV
jgi:tRNA(fMet)-specific endonuclease VapC